MAGDPLDIPKKIVRLWGEDSSAAIGYLAGALNARALAGPRTWKHGTLIPFCANPTDDIRVLLDLAKCGDGYDSCLRIQSKTIFCTSRPDDPWMGAPGAEGYVTCLVLHLAHAKWCSAPGSGNPSWVMTLEQPAARNALAWLADFDALQAPVIASLTSDAALARTLQAALLGEEPAWVKSAGPGRMPWLAPMLAALQRA